MKKWLGALLALGLVGGCSSTSSEAYLASPPIEVETGDLKNYWVDTSDSLKIYPDHFPQSESGSVSVNYMIDSNGNVFNPTIIKSEPKGDWDMHALMSLSKFRYEAAESNPTLIPVYVTSEFTFELRQ